MPLAQPERRATGEQDPGWGGMSAKPPARVSQGRKKGVLSLARSRAESVGHGLGASKLPGGGSCKLS